MKIIAGDRRGHKFDGPKDDVTRPTSDLVREAIFNIIGEGIDGRLALDLFAGTGALGLEALSRGASRAIFVELSRDNVGLIRKNISTLRYEDRAVARPTDAHRFARSFEPTDEPLVVFLDPPYREYENHSARVRKTLENLVSRLPAGTILSVESRKDLDASILPDFTSWDVRRYGGTQLAIRVLGEVPEEPADDTDDEPADLDG